MQIETTRFGTITVEDHDILTFSDGLPGFESCRYFALVPHHTPHGDKASPFRWLQSVEDGSLAFLTMDPGHIFPSYAPPIPKADLALLEIEEAKLQPRIYTLLTVPKGDPCGITANLMAPVLVNPVARLARQVVVSGDEYGLRHRLLPTEPA